MNVSKLMARFQSFKVTGQGLYFATFVAYLLVSFLRTTTYTDFISQNRLNQLSFAFVALLLCKIYFFDRQTFKTFLGISMIVVLGLLIWRKTQNHYNHAKKVYQSDNSSTQELKRRYGQPNQ